MTARSSGRLLFVLLCATMATAVCAGSPTKTGRVTSIDGEHIAYETAGDGEPAIVFVHGWSCDRTYFQHQFKAFAGRYRVVALDLAGHGESTTGRKNSTIALYGTDVAAVVKKLGLSRAVLVGHSMGGDVVVAAARLLEGRVAGLVWVDDYKNLGSPRTDAQIEAFVAPFRADFPGTTDKLVRSMFRPDADPKLVDRVAKDMASAPPLIGVTSIESSFKYAREIPAALAELKLPVIAINADNGPTDSESLASHGVKAVVMPATGHFLMLDDPQRFNILLATALEDIPK